jgi:hypothetical protein
MGRRVWDQVVTLNVGFMERLLSTSLALPPWVVMEGGCKNRYGNH